MLGGYRLMRSLFNVAVFGLLMCAVVAVSPGSVLAQDAKAELYGKFTCCWERESPAEIADMSPDDLQASVDSRKEAVAAGKEFIQKYGNSPDDKAIVDWLTANLKSIEDSIKSDEALVVKKQKKIESDARLNAFDTAYKAKNWNAVFAAGEKILQAEPDFYDVAVVMASVGFDEAEDKKDALNDATIKHAMYAIKKLEANVKPQTDSCAGPYYTYKTKEYPSCAPNALGYMNYTIGYIKHYRQKKTDEAIPFFFKATQAESATKMIPDVYRVIGSWYITKSNSITEKRTAATTELNKEIELPTPDAEKIKQLNAEIDSYLSVERGYADRAIDAYSRAYSLVPAADRSKDYGAGLFGTLKKLYSVRYYEKPEMQTDAQINMNVSMVKTKSMPDPDSAVQPVVEAKPVDPVTTATPTTTVKTGTSRTRTVTVNATSNTVDN